MPSTRACWRSPVRTSTSRSSPPCTTRCRRCTIPFVDLVPPEGLRLTPRHYAYLKISEGCNNRCSFCIIPHLRGDLVSRPASHVMTEAERLVKAGVKELLVISQDTSAYGLDLKYAESPWKGAALPARFLDLCTALGELGAWVRLHYVYPYPHVDDVIPLMAEGKILPYLDIPFQHASPAVLKAMRRPAHQEKTLERLARWRAHLPRPRHPLDLHRRLSRRDGRGLRSCCSTGCARRSSRASAASSYEPVEGAKANELPGAVPDEVKDERWHRFMAVAAGGERGAACGPRSAATIDVIVDEVDEEGALGRSQWDAPEIDGSVFLNGDDRREAGRHRQGPRRPRRRVRPVGRARVA